MLQDKQDSHLCWNSLEMNSFLFQGEFGVEELVWPAPKPDLTQAEHLREFLSFFKNSVA